MSLFHNKTRKLLTGFFVLLLFFSFSAVGVLGWVKVVHADLAAEQTAAQLKSTAGEKPTVGYSNSPGDPTFGPAWAAESVNENIIKPSTEMVLVSVLLNSFQFLLDRLAYEAAVAIASLGAGETPLIIQKEGQDLWKDIGMDLAGEFVGELSDMTEDVIGFNLCAPPNPLVRMNLQIGIKQSYQSSKSATKPKCDILKVGQNWKGFFNSALQLTDNPGDAIIEEFAKSLKPGRNELSASLEIMLEAEHRIDIAKATGFQQALAGDGFKPVTDFVTGQVTTPSSVLKKQFEKTTIEDRDKAVGFHMQSLLTNPDYLWAMLFNTLSIFTNTLLSESLNRIYTGMFETSPEIDPFDLEALSNNDRQSAIDRFSSYATTQPTSISNYNVMAEFVVCPSGGIAVPNLNNCVMDSNFAAAVFRSASKNPLTVQEAIDEGLLNGGWSLIPPSDIAKNQDSLCYTNAYCYGNLVKMRRARILPVGWEMAAERNEGGEATLQQIIDGFNKCNSEGGLGNDDYKWCHLIDPNWVLKYSETQCRAFVNGDQLVTTFGNGRAGICVDAPSCISENNNGTCQGGYGYCVQEKNIWRFRGDECPAQFAGCLKFQNSDTNSQKSLLVNTIDFSVCGQANAGCYWYRTNKYLADQGNTDPNDDTYEFLPAGVSYDTAARDNEMEYVGATRNFEYYAHEDRIYFDRDAQECGEQDVGCTKLYQIDENLVFNAVMNGGFERDEDRDGVPDGWSRIEASEWETDETEANSGSHALQVGPDPNNSVIQSGIKLAANAFYTFSLYAKQGATDPTEANAKIRFYDVNGSQLAIAGLSTTCNTNDNLFSLNLLGINDVYQSFNCTFTTPARTDTVSLEINPSGRVLFDDIQIELGVAVSNFADGYNRDGATSYLKLAPEYLGCEGKIMDPKECGNYTQVCSEQDVGCNLYTPLDGGPAIPAIISAVDVCPAECVGYAPFKQEATKYEQAFFPEYFIAQTAAICTAEQVGCDAFTNLDSIEAGGEGVEYYTDLRACLKPVEAGDNTGTDRAANYFTWEGTDQAGYQLRSWWLLKSDSGNQPCNSWMMNGASSLVCNDTGVNDLACDDRDDLLTNPDCREFYDEDGVISYRRYSRTVTITDDCHPYRKTISLREDCSSSGGFFTATGECRYLGWPEGSKICSAGAVGCRNYTGGAGRNFSTILDETFESGTYENFSVVGSITEWGISNESLAPNGHSLRIQNADSGEGVQTIYDDSVEPAQGSLVDSIVAGKSYNLDFWAKGGGDIKVAFRTGDGLSIPFGSDDDAAMVSLDGAWQLYSLGPLDTSQISGFDETVVLIFVSEDDNNTFYLDNIQLKQVEENITLIKDSWVTSVSCDQTPTGINSPQYYLGCQAYTDIDNQTHNLYQFSRLCGEDRVGCEAYYQTYNSESPYGQVFNARCLIDSDNRPAEVLPEDLIGELATAQVACVIDGKTYCTIQPGNNYCLFNQEEAISRPLSGEGNFKIVLGPEAKVVSGDKPVFLIDHGSTSCSAANAGCGEVGKPTFNRDKSEVTKFESAYFINNPDDYESSLCEHEALFCAEWSSTKDGNFFFKDPLDQVCEYKTNITIESEKFYGWFRQGSAEPCYWDDLDDDGFFNPSKDSSLTIQGDKFGVWRNGDADYDGWAASCPDNQDLCTEFIDTTDTRGKISGKAYYFKNNESLSESVLASTQRCDGQVSRELGCALLQNTSLPGLSYSSAPSYIASVHADLLYGDQPFALVDPISCESNNRTGQNQSGINLCASRCEYQTAGSDLSGTLRIGTKQYGTACVIDDDCPILDGDGINYSGTCRQLDPEVDKEALFSNDANMVIKVIRDRECAKWLTWDNYSMSFNEREQKWLPIYQNIKACSVYNKEGNTTNCAEPSPPSAPIVLSDEFYALRDVSWTGVEYSGYSIPNKLPVDIYKQVNLYPSKYCADENGTPYTNNGNVAAISCRDDDDCAAYFPAENCVSEVEEKPVLAYWAGSCDEEVLGRGANCTVGICSNDSSQGCALDEECGLGQCMIGVCQDVSSLTCSYDSDCNSDSNYPVCDTGQGVCVDMLKSDPGVRFCSRPSDCSSTTNKDPNFNCTPVSTTRTGSCINNQCLVRIDGEPLIQTINGSANLIGINEPECRGNPEIDSPFPSGDNGVVESWRGGGIDDGQRISRVPKNTRIGYEKVNVCEPLCDDKGECIETNDCVCSYQKVIYGKDSLKKYYPLQMPAGRTIYQGVCLTGDREGYECNNDLDCRTTPASGQEDNPEAVLAASMGFCETITRTEKIYGWPGYCLENDTSTQLNGGREAEDQACLTWLPTDQLLSATDLYGKQVEAGFQADDTYYCTEVGYYMDLYPLGSKFDPSGALSNDSTDKRPRIEYACAASNVKVLYDCNLGQYGNDNDDGPFCYEHAWCPQGWVALLGTCDSGAAEGSENERNEVFCTQSDSYVHDYSKGAILTRDKQDDCPYICVPEDSYHEKTGKSCLSNLSSSNVGLSFGRIEETPVVKMGNLTKAKIDKYADCVVKGVPVNSNKYDTDWAFGYCQNNTDKACLRTSDCLEIDSLEDLLPEQIEAASCIIPYTVYTQGGYSVVHEVPEVPENVTASSFSSHYLSLVSGEYSMNQTSAYNIAHRTVGSKAKYCTNSRKICETDQDCDNDNLIINQLVDDTNIAIDALNCVTNFIQTYPLTLVLLEYITGICIITEIVGTVEMVDSECVDMNYGRPFTSGSIVPYLGCYELTQVASGESVDNAKDLNKAWTNRLWAESNFQTLNFDRSVDSTRYEYEYETSLAPAGRAPVIENDFYLVETTNRNSEQILLKTNQRVGPIPVESCKVQTSSPLHNSLKPGALGLSTQTECLPASFQETYQYPLNKQKARTYEDFNYESGQTNFGELDAVIAIGDISPSQYASFGSSKGYKTDQASVQYLLNQLFAKTYRRFTYEWNADDGQSTYVLVPGQPADISHRAGDLQFDGQPENNFDKFPLSPIDETDYSDVPPKVVAIGDCVESTCAEHEVVNTFSVNDNPGGNVNGTDGSLYTTVRFYTYASPNQMPIRNIVIDWGSDFGFDDSGKPDWPTGSQLGSKASDNYYKNHRGNKGPGGESWCDGESWGRTSKSCEGSYLTFVNNYKCTANMVDTLDKKGRTCRFDSATGKLLKSPCTDGEVNDAEGKCVYQPRVFVKDNWGWCTGTCDDPSANEDGTPQCYGAECDPKNCPGGLTCPDLGVGNIDPWVYYDGYIIVTP